MTAGRRTTTTLGGVLEWVPGFRELALSVDVVDTRELEVIKSPRTN